MVRRTAKLLVEHDEDLATEEDALAALQAADVARRLRHPEPFEVGRRGAFLDGFSLHARIRIHAGDRDGREWLCRYILRPPLALHRLSRSEGGGLVYRMKRPRRGSLWLSLTSEELLAKLASLVPPSRVHDLRNDGVFAPHAGLRCRVVPDPLEEPSTPQIHEALPSGPRRHGRSRPRPWHPRPPTPTPSHLPSGPTAFPGPLLKTHNPCVLPGDRCSSLRRRGPLARRRRSEGQGSGRGRGRLGGLRGGEKHRGTTSGVSPDCP